MDWKLIEGMVEAMVLAAVVYGAVLCLAYDLNKNRRQKFQSMSQLKYKSRK